MSGLPSWKNKYKAARNKALTMLRRAKQKYFDSCINSASNKQFWKTIKSLKRDAVIIPTLTDDDHNEAIGDQDKANMLSSFFSKCFNTIQPPLSDSDTQQLITDRVDGADNLDTLLCTEEEVLHLLQTIDTTKANGPDQISGKMLKMTALSIAYPITVIFNKSIASGVFPTSWKSSYVVPIPKANCYNNPSNYRPVSLLPILSKLLEKHIYSLLNHHLQNTQPLSNFQWGFQAGKSTVTALLETTHNWLQLMEEGHEVGAVFFDLKKAFDSVPHRALLQKLETIGVNKLLLKWLHSYLTNRKQQVVVNGATSTPANVLSGVPQGSVIGPLHS